MRVLFVQQDHMSPTGPVGEAFTDHGFDVQEFMVVPEEHFHEPAVTVAFPDPLAFDAIVPMGAAWSVYDHDRIGTWIGDELDFLRRAHGAGVPVLGICFGGQALAAALGGMVVRAEVPEIGWTTVETSLRTSSSRGRGSNGTPTGGSCRPASARLRGPRPPSRPLPRAARWGCSSTPNSPRRCWTAGLATAAASTPRLSASTRDSSSQKPRRGQPRPASAHSGW